MRDTFKARLAGGTALTALLTGGVNTTLINRQETPGAFDANGEIRPCAFVKVESEAPSGPYTSSGRLYVTVYVYERSGYTTIDAALEEVFSLLNYWKPSGNTWEVRHAGDTRDVGDEALGCSMSFGRYVATRLR
jgi:hypothetical protein